MGGGSQGGGGDDKGAQNPQVKSQKPESDPPGAYRPAQRLVVSAQLVLSSVQGAGGGNGGGGLGGGGDGGW